MLPNQVFKTKRCVQCAESFEPHSPNHRYCQDCGDKRAAEMRKGQIERNVVYRAERRKADKAYRSQEYFRDGLRKHYSMSVSDYDRMLQRQKGVCLICRNPCKSGRRLAVDHDAKTGRVRGLLCGSCNRAIGGLEHDPARLERAAAYLRGRL